MMGRNSGIRIRYPVDISGFCLGQVKCIVKSGNHLINLSGVITHAMTAPQAFVCRSGQLIFRVLQLFLGGQSE